MELNRLLIYRDVSQYRLSKLTDIPQSTISDICSCKTDIRKCEAFTLYKIAKVLNVTIEDIFTKEIDLIDIDDFENFKSNVCHMYKNEGVAQFVNSIIENELIDSYYENKSYAKAFYLLGFVDYVCDKHKMKSIKKYDQLRQKSLLNRIYPKGVLILNKVFNNTKYSRKSVRDAIPQLKRFNIIEGDIENVQ